MVRHVGRGRGFQVDSDGNVAEDGSMMIMMMMLMTMKMMTRMMMMVISMIITIPMLSIKDTDDEECDIFSIHMYLRSLFIVRLDDLMTVLANTSGSKAGFSSYRKNGLQ